MTPSAEPDEVGYGKPPKHSQFQKGTSGNPKGRPKEEQKFKTMNRIIQDVLLKEVTGHVGGKLRKMPGIEAVVAVQLAKALSGDSRAAKLVLDRGDKHIASHQTLAELMGGRPVFMFTKEEAARFTRAKLLEGMILPEDDEYSEEDDSGGQPVL